jgi:hypothetical protein
MASIHPQLFDVPGPGVFNSNVTLSFTGLPAAAGDILIEADVDGDFSGRDEIATFINEDLIPFLTLGRTGVSDSCIRDSGNATVTADVFNGWKADSNVKFLVVVSSVVDAICDTNSLRITLSYESKSGVTCPAFPTMSPT